ncbi:MAG: hypothetical protein LBP89_10040 [Helicobacteraceae bacterium]|jgi:hypothetical protein|nr:hypothetical protein [Helicobacteraceae bacterium]
MTIPSIKAYFDAKAGDADLIHNYFDENICIEDTGENNVVSGFNNCKNWLKEKSRQYKMETKIIDLTTDTNGITKVSVLVSGDFSQNAFAFDYYFTIINDKIKKVKIIYTGGINSG